MRRPERNLEVLWQRHIPQGVGTSHSDERVDAVTDLYAALETALEEARVDAYGALLDRGDLVLTLSVRPPS